MTAQTPTILETLKKDQNAFQEILSDDELAALKNRLAGGTPVSLPLGSSAAPQLEPVKVSEVDPELEELKRSIDKL